MWRYLFSLLLISVFLAHGKPQAQDTLINEDYSEEEEDVDVGFGIGETTFPTIPPTTTPSTPPPHSCPSPFQMEGDQCLYFASFAEESQQECRQMCHSLRGELVGIRTATQLKHIIDLIYAKGLQDKSFWIDGTDVEAEMEWTFSTGESVPMGTPFWAASELIQSPDGSKTENCADITSELGYLIDDEDCAAVRSPLCEHHLVSVKHNIAAPVISNAECPPFYVNIRGICFAFITWAEQGWGEAAQTCHGLSGELASFNDIEILRDIYVYINNEGISSHSFWLGGSDSAAEGTWLWKDGTAVPSGTPFWGNRGNPLSLPEPDGDVAENCLAITADGVYFFRDKDCKTETLNPLCSTIPL